jgi:hypothetical protein
MCVRVFFFFSSLSLLLFFCVCYCCRCFTSTNLRCLFSSSLLFYPNTVILLFFPLSDLIDRCNCNSSKRNRRGRDPLTLPARPSFLAAVITLFPCFPLPFQSPPPASAEVQWRIYCFRHHALSAPSLSLLHIQPLPPYPSSSGSFHCHLRCATDGAFAVLEAFPNTCSLPPLFPSRHDSRFQNSLFLLSFCEEYSQPLSLLNSASREPRLSEATHLTPTTFSTFLCAVYLSPTLR